MSNLFSSILAKGIVLWNDAEQAIDSVWEKAAAAFPTLAADEKAVVANLKQQASNAFAFVDTELAPRYVDAVSMAESAGDTMIMALTHGAAGPALPLVNVGISQGFALLHAALDHAEAEAKAKFALPAPTSSAAPSLTAAAWALANDIAVAPAVPAAPAAVVVK